MGRPAQKKKQEKFKRLHPEGRKRWSAEKRKLKRERKLNRKVINS